MAPRILLLPLLVVHLSLAVAYPPSPPWGQPAVASLAPAAAGPDDSAAPVVLAQARPTAAPTATPKPSEDFGPVLARAESQRAAGEPEAALATLQPYLGHPDPTIAFEAGFRQAALRIELGFPGEAAGGLEELLARFPNAARADRAAFLLSLARRQADDCRGSITAMADYTARSSALGPYADLVVGRCYQRLGDTAAALARTEDALQAGGPRLLQIEALERQAAILEEGGDQAGALARWQRLIDLARGPSYKADVRMEVARLSRALGRDAAAVAQYAAIVNEAPTLPRAATALDQLVALDAQDQISFFQAGLVRYWSRSYEAAIRNLEGSLATPGEAKSAAAAAYYHAAARLRQGSEDAGVAELLALAGTYPNSPYAPDALLRAGKVLESVGAFGPAADAYRRLARDFPASQEAKEGLFRQGLARLLGSAPDQATAAWQELEASDAPAELKALGRLWRGKLEVAAGRADPARAAWQGAVDLGPTWYGGIRARGLLDGNVGARVEVVGLDPSRLEPSPAELAELSAWMADRGAALDPVMAELAADPAMARLDDLLALGMGGEAAWEIDELAARFAADPARLAGLALALHQRGLANPSLTKAQAALDAAQIGSREAPTALQKLLYPLPFAEQLAARAERYGLSPLVLAALVRQESLFDPRARSSADARGLTQVVPSTGRGIAAALNRPDFQVDDLYRPTVALEFGAYYLAQRLQHFGGALFPALAAYNAGEGTVDRWVRDYGTADMDLFADRIPFPETNRYVKVIVENYGLYRALYGVK